MSQESRRKAGAYDTHSVDINIEVGSAMGHKSMRDLHSNTVSPSSHIRNDISPGISLGSNSPVKRDVNDNSSIGEDIGVGIHGLHVQKGHGWKNLTK